MMVFFNKKEVTLEYTPIRLERRHTMAEGRLDVDKSSRTGSVSSYSDGTKTITSLEHESRARSSLSQGRRNTISAAPAVVITENELSSSWLYESQKAHVNATTGISPNSKSQVTSSSLENLLPEARQDPRISTSVPMEHRHGKRSSCCCYATIVAIIFFTSLGILAAIGGIVYMEIFVGQEVKDNHTMENLNGIVNFNNSVQKLANEREEKLGKSLLPTEIKENELFKETPDIQIDDAKADILPDGSSIEFQLKLGHESKLNTLHVNDKISFTDQIPTTISPIENSGKNLDSFHTTENVKINLSNIMSRLEVATEIPDPKKIEVSREFGSILDGRLLDGNGNINLSTHDLKNIKEHEKTNGSKDIEERNSSIGNEQKTSEPKEFMLPDFVEEPISHLDKQKDVDYVNTVEVSKEDRSFTVLENLDLTTESILLSTKAHELEVLNDSLTSEESAKPINFGGENESSSDSDFDRLSPMNRSTDDANVLPLEFFSRLGFNRDYIANHPALTVEDMNVKFSLAEALKYLRSLDVNDKHATSRRKPVTPESNKKRFQRKLDVDNGEERKRYLQKLRKTIFD